jgi:hypothetical protein
MMLLSEHGLAAATVTAGTLRARRIRQWAWQQSQYRHNRGCLGVVTHRGGAAHQ